MSNDKYALLNHDNLVMYIGSSSDKSNSEPSLVWVPILPHHVVKIGYRYNIERNQFERVRLSLKEEKMKLLEINNQVYADKMKAILSGYHEYEVMTFGRQAQELDFYERMKRGDHSGKIIFVRALCQARGIPEDLLWAKLDEKNTAFTWAAGFLTGTRQRFEDYINLVDTIEQLDEVEMQINAWRNS